MVEERAVEKEIHQNSPEPQASSSKSPQEPGFSLLEESIARSRRNLEERLNRMSQDEDESEDDDEEYRPTGGQRGRGRSRGGVTRRPRGRRGRGYRQF